MSKQINGSNCKICSKVYTVFRWKPDRKQVQKSTEICTSCSKVRNLCQTCIKDLQFNLPSQLRDAVLSAANSIATIENSSNVAYQEQNALALINSGNNIWQQSDNPNEKLLQIARKTSTNRYNKKIKVSNNNYSDKYKSNSDSFKSNDDSNVVDNVPLPVGINSLKEIPNMPEAYKSFYNVNDNDGKSNNNEKKVDNNNKKRKKLFALPAGVQPPLPST